MADPTLPFNDNYFPSTKGDGRIGAPIGPPTGLVIGGPPFDWQSTILSQYANSPRITQMLASFSQAIDQQANIDAFFDMVWNIDTAQGWGLDVWGRIVFISRNLAVDTRFFGFEEGAGDFDPFNTSPFYSGQSLTANFALTDSAFRALILAKALANITYGSIPGINAILQMLFPGRGPCYVMDNLDMTMTYTFGFKPNPVELAIIQTSNVLPRPTGVKVIVSTPP